MILKMNIKVNFFRFFHFVFDMQSINGQGEWARRLSRASTSIMQQLCNGFSSIWEMLSDIDSEYSLYTFSTWRSLNDLEFQLLLFLSVSSSSIWTSGAGLFILWLLPGVHFHANHQENKVSFQKVLNNGTQSNSIYVILMFI